MLGIPKNTIVRYVNQEIGSLRSFRRFKRTMTMVERLDFSEEDLRQNELILRRFCKVKNRNIRTINWFVQSFGQPYAGIFNILRFADHFQNRKQAENRIIIYDLPAADPDEFKTKITGFFPGLRDVKLIVARDSTLDDVPASDVAIATHWTSAFSVLKFKRTMGKFYFIQDYEPLFYPAGSLYGLAEATYRFGFHGIVNTPGLWEAVRNQLMAPSMYFMPAIDHQVFYPPLRREPGRPFSLFFYGRPEIDRNAFELGIAAIKLLKQKWGERLQVQVAGSPSSRVLRSCDGLVHNLGFLPYAETGDLYRRCDAGLVFMLTRHPSYIPFELMGCGAVVVSNRNPANQWLLRDRENCLLCEPVPSQVAEAVGSLISSPGLAEKLASEGRSTVSGLSWEEAIEAVFDFMAQRELVPAGPEPDRARI